MRESKVFGVSLVPEDALKTKSAVSTEPRMQRRVRSLLNVPESVEQESEEIKKSQYISKMELADRFHTKTKDQIVGEIHVWWLYDDGGILSINLFSPKKTCLYLIFFQVSRC